MNIQFETSTMTLGDAAALIALLGMRFPEALDNLEAAGLRVQGFDPGGAPDPVSAFTSEPTAERAFAAAPQPPAPGPDEEGVPFAGGVETAAALAALPAAASAEPVAAPALGDLDADGLPWDARIHSEGKNRTKTDNKWRLKRNVPEATRAAVVAELRAAMGAPAVPPAPVAAAVAETPAPPPPPPVQSAAPAPSPPSPPEAAPVPQPPAPAAVPVPPSATVPSAIPAETPPAPPVSGAQTFAAVMRKITEAQGSGKITAAETTSLATQVGLENVRGLLSRPDLIPAFEELFNAYLGA